MIYRDFIKAIKEENLSVLKDYLRQFEYKDRALLELSEALSRSLEFKKNNLFKELIEFGINELDLRLLDKMTMSHLSIFDNGKNLEMVLEKGLIKTTKNKNLTSNVITSGICNNNYEFIKTVIENKLININKLFGVNKEPLLFIAVNRGHYRITKLLIENGANYQVLNKNGKNIFDAIKEGQRKYENDNHNKIMDFINSIPDDYKPKNNLISKKSLEAFNNKKTRIKSLKKLRIKL